MSRSGILTRKRFSLFNYLFGLVLFIVFFIYEFFMKNLSFNNPKILFASGVIVAFSSLSAITLLQIIKIRSTIQTDEKGNVKPRKM